MAIMHVLLLTMVVLYLPNMVCSVDSEALMVQCSHDVEKVGPCFNYATGKSATPPKDCCTSVREIRDKEPECLCFLILAAHNGSIGEIKTSGIREDKLLSLPFACNLVNSSVSNCPKLLNITESSPQYKFFVNNNTASPNKIFDSKSFKHGPAFQLVGLVVAVATFIFTPAAFSPLCT